MGVFFVIRAVHELLKVELNETLNGKLINCVNFNLKYVNCWRFLTSGLAIDDGHALH